MKTSKLILSLALSSFAGFAIAKIPPAPPPDPAVAAAKAEKDKATAEKTKAEQAKAEDNAVKSFQANMKKAGKPIPKPTPIVVAGAPAVPAKPGAPVAAAPKSAPAKAPPAKK